MLQGLNHITIAVSDLERSLAFYTELLGMKAHVRWDGGAKLRQAAVPEWQQNSSEGQSVYFLDPDGHKLEAHCGNLQTRLDALKHKPYSGLVWL